MAADALKVFVSSTSKDLTDYRAAARNVILDQQWQPVMMEHFGARPDATVDACVAAVRECDLVLLIVAHRRGYVPTEEQKGNGVDSITSLELQAARAAGIPVLAFLASETWPGNLWEDDSDARRYIRSFRENLNQVARFFEAEPDEKKPLFEASVRESIVTYRESLLKKEGNGAWEGQTNLDSLPMAIEDLCDGLAIPFLGQGVLQDGPLSSAQLSLALSKDLASTEPTSLATAAEYVERLGGSRERLVSRFAKIIEQQEKELGTCPIYELLARLEKQRFVVAATYDRMLESTLDVVGRPYVVIKHVIRSWEGENDGKILVLPKNGEPKLSLADEVELPPDHLILYRPLGSPLPDEGVPEDLEIDTLVVTETDHLTFLGRLENQHTKIPAALARFMRKPFLFLGYALEAWHYRLVAHVFQELGQQRRRGSVFAVRKPTSRIEDLAWKRLGVDVIHTTAEQFVTAASQLEYAGAVSEGL